MPESVAIITPCRRSDRLHEAFQSILSADWGQISWRWYLGEIDQAVPKEILSHPNVWTFRVGNGLGGDMRQQIIDRLDATTTHFLELDPEDLLRPQAVTALIVGSAGRGVAYGDCSLEMPTGSMTLDADHGWTHRGDVVEMFDPCPRSLCDVMYSPVGPRLWHLADFRGLGGYTPGAVYGDVELPCRAYAAGVPVSHVKHHVATVRRFDRPRDLEFAGTQTASEQARQRIVHENLDGLVRAWCERNGHRTLTLKPSSRVPDFYGKQWGLIEAYDVIDKLPRGVLVEVMNRAYAALVPGGWLRLRTPSADGRGAFMNPESVSHWNQSSFLYFTDRRFSSRIQGVDCRFQAFRVWTAPDEEIDVALNVTHAHADLVAIKGQRQPGPVRI